MPIDDGVTGTIFDRPQFNAMLQDIEKGVINCIVVRDLSRFGRNRRDSGYYREDVFPEYGVRLISADGSYDSLTDDDGINAPIHDLMNEYYSKTISKNTRKAKRIMAEQGKYDSPRAPYGYLKSPENKHVLMVDDNVAHNVTRIFTLFNGGMTGRAIADLFNREGIPSANVYYSRLTQNPNKNKSLWGSASVTNIIQNHAYYGAVVRGKRKVKSLTDKSMVRIPESEWIIREDMHTPIVSKEVWEMAQTKCKKNKRDTIRRSADGDIKIFSGIIVCAHCGGRMNKVEVKTKTFPDGKLRCSSYTQSREACHMQAVDYKEVYQAVLLDIQEYAILAIEDEKKLIDRIIADNNKSIMQNTKLFEKQIREAESRIEALDILQDSLYEDVSCGKITQDFFNRRLNRFTEEQNRLIDDVSQMKERLDESQRTQHNLSEWIERVKDCITIDSLTRQIIVGLIDRIEVTQTNDTNGETVIDLNISYKFGATASPKRK